MNTSPTLKQKIFITGASSEIMQKFIALIDKSKFDLYCLSRTKSDKEDGIQFCKGDLLDLSHLKDVIASSNIIIHAAAITHSLEKKPYYDINYERTKALVDLCTKSTKFVFVSSRVAGVESGAYGHSKLLAENYIRERCEFWLIFRPAEVFGVSKNEGIESLLNDCKHKKIIPYPLGVKSKLVPIHVNDLVEEIHTHIFELDTQEKTITINGNKSYNYRELIELVSRFYGNKPVLIPVPKFIMRLLANLIRNLKIKTDIVPDQVSRLYSTKDERTSNRPGLSIEKYLKKT